MKKTKKTLTISDFLTLSEDTKSQRSDLLVTITLVLKTFKKENVDRGSKERRYNIEKKDNIECQNYVV